jgi:AAHS family 4-hydroxybenzoate transporter-like MFS transporter
MVVAGMSLGAAYAESQQSLMWWRLLTGIGLGGVVPNATALMVEYAPGSVRNVIVALTIVGVPIGGVLGAEVAAQILPIYGWRAVFLIGAALPLLLAIAMTWLLPESPRFLARDSRRHDQLAQVLNQVIAATRFSSSDRFLIAQEASAAPVGVRSLFGRDMRRETLLIWLIFVTNIFAVYAFFNWLPTVLTTVGLSQTVALRGALFFNLGGVIASLIVAGLTARWGSRPVLITLGVGAIVFTAAMGLLGDASRNEAQLIAIMALAGACILSIQVTMYAVAANAYPTAARATGVGWASGFARIGGILSSFSGGVLLSMGSGLAPFFYGIAAVLLLTTIGIVLLRRHSPANA